MEQKPKILTNKESLSIDSVVLTKDALIQEIYQGESFPVDNRFLEKEKGGVFHYFDIQNLSSFSSSKGFLSYPVIKLNNIIVGISELEQDPHNENIFWLKSIDIDPAYQGRGLARKLLEIVFDFAKNKKHDLLISMYSDDGSEKIRHIIKELSESKGVQIYENTR